MKLRPWLKLSLALNALLIGCVTWLGWTGSRPDSRAETPRYLTNRVLRLASPTDQVEPQVIAVNEPFHWSQVESTDYRVYLTNLRAIHCPESTVRDIIMADVNDIFTARVQELVNSVTGQFWDLMTHQYQFKDVVEQKGKELDTMKEERDAIFENLFGDRNPLADEGKQASATWQREQWARLGDFLPANKLEQFVSSEEEFARAKEEISATQGLSNAERQAKLKTLADAHDRALRDWLTPSEYDELRLRQSDVAQNLHQPLTGLDLSDEEALALAKIKSESKNTQADAQIKELLGPERTAALQRATDNRYGTIYRVTQRLNLPDTVAVQVYDMRMQAENAARQLLADKSLSDEQRRTALLGIGGETAQSMTATLGQKAFSAYKTIDPGWWQQFPNPAKP